MTVHRTKIRCSPLHFQWVLKLFLALCLWQLMPAQSVADETPWYQVEVVVFRHAGARALTQELHLKPLASIDHAGAIDLPWFANDNSEASTATVDQHALQYFRPLPSSANSLEPIRLALSKRGGYQVIGMLGWQQAGLPQNKSYPVFVRLGEQRWFSQMRELPKETSSFAVAPQNPLAPSNETALTNNTDPSKKTVPSIEMSLANETVLSNEFTFLRELNHEFEGTINIYRERFLHIQTNMIYRISHTDLPQEIAELLSAQQDLAIPLQHQRRARSSETHYLDNPVVGMIVRTIPLETIAVEKAPKETD